MCPDPVDNGVPRFEYDVCADQLIEHRDFHTSVGYDAETRVLHDPSMYSLILLSNTTKDAVKFRFNPAYDDRVHVTYVLVYKEIADAGLGALFYDAGNDAVRLDQRLLQTIASYLRANKYAGLTIAEFLKKIYGTENGRGSGS